jgi:hypothetical protein
VIVVSLTQAAIAHVQLLDLGARVALAAADPSGAATTGNVDTDTDTESKKSGPIGLVLIIVLCVACYFLFKSMSKRLRAVREGRVPISAPPAPPAASTPSTAAAPRVGSDVVETHQHEPAPPPTP